MEKLYVIAAGLGWSVLERNARDSIAGMRFIPRESVFPALTCVAQASLRTGLSPREHKVLYNGFWIDELQKPMFWEQSSKLVKGARVWDEARSKGKKAGLYFFQQSLGESVDAIVSPAPIHKHSGGMFMSCYLKPTEEAHIVESLLGKFPLHKYWGPLASAKVGRSCIDWFEASLRIYDVDEAYLYLPTLDYAAQRNGPGSKEDKAAFAELCGQLERLAGICEGYGADMSVSGDYDITSVLSDPVTPNVTLRREGLFVVRNVHSRAYPDFYSSQAFAICDHELCVLRGEKRELAAEILLATGDYEPADNLSSDQVLLLAKKGSYCSYKWWTKKSEAPDYASHIDIHNKPGFDPGELFFFCGGVAKGTHGRKSFVATTEEKT